MSAWSTSGVSLAEKLKQQKAATNPSKEEERQQETSPAAAAEVVEAKKEDGPRRSMKKSEKAAADVPVAAASQDLEKPQPAVAPPVSVSGPADESDDASHPSSLPIVTLPAEVAALVSDEFSFVGVYTKPEAPVALTTTEVAPVAPAPLKNELPVVAPRAAASSAAPAQPAARYPTHHHHHQHHHHHHNAAGAPIHTNSYGYPPYGMMPSYGPRPYSGYPNQYAGYPVYPEQQYYGNQMGYGYGRGGQFNPSGLFSTARGGYRGNSIYRGAPVHQYDSFPPQYNYDQAQSEPL